jgi:hypothetical protein
MTRVYTITTSMGSAIEAASFADGGEAKDYVSSLRKRLMDNPSRTKPIVIVAVSGDVIQEVRVAE